MKAWMFLCTVLALFVQRPKHFASLRQQLLGNAEYSVPRRTHPPRQAREPEDAYKF